MEKNAEIVKYIVFAILIIFASATFKHNIFAEEVNDKVVKVGYYENENFQEGATYLPLLNQALNSIEENSAINYSLKYVDNSNN